MLPRRCTLSWLAIAFGAPLLAAPAAKEPPKTEVTPPSVRIEVTVKGLTRDQGLVRCALHTSADTFPGKTDRAAARATSKVDGRKATCVFSGVGRGTYAISVYHDENSDGQLARDGAGVPIEPWGVSNDATGFMGPPAFDDAKFNYNGDVLRMSISLN